MSAISEFDADIPWDRARQRCSRVSSAIDAERLHLDDRMPTQRSFSHRTGSTIGATTIVAKLDELRREAINVYRKRNCCYDEPHLSITPQVRESSRMSDAGFSFGRPHELAIRRGRLWACSVLRVMHTFAYCSNYFKEVFDQQIREQILARFESHVSPTQRRLSAWERSGGCARLADFQLKGGKSRESLAMKLLHKADNVATDIFDWVGVRFIAHERFDCLLDRQVPTRVHNVVNVAHIRPGRSRNTRWSIWTLSAPRWRQLEWQVRAGKLASYEKLDRLRDITRDMPYPQPPSSAHNVFSSVAYHSIQFTCSHPIRVRNPWVPMSQRAMTMDRAGNAMLRRFLGGIGMQPDIQFRFPV